MSIQIPRLTIIEDFLSEEEEKELIEFISKQKWIYIGSHRVQHYGYEYNYQPGDARWNYTHQIKYE